MATQVKKHPKWKRYEVHSDGTVRNILNNQILKPLSFKPHISHNQRLRVTLKDHVGKRRKVFLHRLVAECFLPRPKGCKYVLHRDGDYSNNSVTNLAWSAYPQKILVLE